jgi:hypothetical protein
MANGAYCCAIGVCCPPDSEARRAALIDEMTHGIAAAMPAGLQDGSVHPNTIAQCADWLIANVDMVPKGTINLAAVVELVKKQG